MNHNTKKAAGGGPAAGGVRIAVSVISHHQYSTDRSYLSSLSPLARRHRRIRQALEALATRKAAQQ